MAADYFVVAFVACVRSGCGGAEVGPSSLFITGLGKVVYIYIYPGRFNARFAVRLWP